MTKIEYSIPAVKSLLAMSSAGSEEEIPDEVASMSDEDFDKLSPEEFEKAVSGEESEEDTENKKEEPEQETQEDNTDNIGDDREEDDSDTDENEEPTPEEGETGSKENKSEEDETKDQPTEMSEEQKAEAVRTYNLLFGSPIKASGREIKLKSPEHAKNFIEMGVDYNKKMQAMRPYRETFETLKKEGLLDPDKRERLNLLLEAEKGNKDAIKRLIAESEIDPLDLADEEVISEGKGYTPQDHIISTAEVQISEALSSIEDTQSYGRTLDVMTKEFDSKSREVISDHPEYIVSLNSDIESGVFDQVMEVVQYKKDMRQVPVGMSDMDLYIATVQDMASYEQQQAAAIAQDQKEPHRVNKSSKKNKLGMSGNKSSKTTKKKDYDPSEIFGMSDADFEKKFPNLSFD